jgi:hypothetical protein
MLGGTEKQVNANRANPAWGWEGHEFARATREGHEFTRATLSLDFVAL